MVYQIQWTGSQIAKAIGASIQGKDQNRILQAQNDAWDVVLDSRLASKSTVFFALVGEKLDAHRFAQQVSDKGSLVVCTKKGLESFSASLELYIVVEDTTLALQNLAKAYQKQMSAQKVVITGSNGKTSTKDLLAAVLQDQAPTLSTMANHNNHIGVPQTIFRIRPEDRYAVLEMGTNHPGEILTLTQMVDSDAAVITSIGQSHLEFFIHEDNVLIEKLTIAQGLKTGGVLFLNAEDDRLWSYAQKVQNDSSLNFKVITVGITRGDIKPTSIHFDAYSKASFEFENLYFQLNIPGRHQLINGLLVWAVARYLGVDSAFIQQSFLKFEGSKMRMQVIEKDDYTLILDCYNANPTSSKAALETLGNMQVLGRKVAVVGDMLELGENSIAYHQGLAPVILNSNIDLVLCVGPHSSKLYEKLLDEGFLSSKVQRFENALALKKQIYQWIEPKDTILLKGSRGIALEQIFAEENAQ